MPATPPGNKGSSTIFVFTPRQVLLSNQTMKHTAQNGTPNSKREPTLLLHQSIARYLELRGFSKTLKKFRSEAQIEKNDLEGSPVDLEEMYLKYIEACGKDAKANINDHNEQVADVPDKNIEGKTKEKKKKKSKLVSESLANNVEDSQLESVTTVADNKGSADVSTDAKVINGSEMQKKSKSKSKKKDKRSGQSDEIAHTEEENIELSSKEMTSEEKKDSKKRKRSISEENGQQVADVKVDEESKRRKIENKNASKRGEKSATTNANQGNDFNSNEEDIVASGQVGGDQLQKASKEPTNGNFENTGEKSSVQRSQKKQQKGSVEQKPVKAAFQRVQVDKIQFTDERLQDNSYWAKDGAENGYGAKAAEILDQVRGRDFRHEKTKKKRGSYRGGNIDVQSHSVKFNYSDEE